jgi:hypothetical protein
MRDGKMFWVRVLDFLHVCFNWAMQSRCQEVVYKSSFTLTIHHFDFCSLICIFHGRLPALQAPWSYVLSSHNDHVCSTNSF